MILRDELNDLDNVLLEDHRFDAYFQASRRLS